MFKIIDAPIPLIAGLASFQLPEGLMGTGSDYFIGFVSAIFTLAYILKAMGKLPGQEGERRQSPFTPEHAEMLEGISKLLSTREEGGFERFLKLNENVGKILEIETQTAETNALLAETLKMMEKHMKIMADFIQRSA